MTRKLLPFEHDLIESLGITREEYLKFVALQSQPDFQGKPTADVTAIVLFVVGLVLQVVGALLAPKPRIPKTQGQPQTRDERFAPRFGFNSQQELAKYGDPVNLVYANRGTKPGENPTGGVRVSSSLLWSAVRSYGSSQFVQMLMAIGGGGITAIDPDKSAFGQTPIRDFITENVWTYFKPGGAGFLQQQHELYGRQTTDPTRYGGATSNPYRIQGTVGANTRRDGFSQTYSPTARNTLGIDGVVPLNIDLFIRNEQGDQVSANNGIYVEDIHWVEGGHDIFKDQSMKVTFKQTPNNPKETAQTKHAKQLRRSTLSVFDQAATFKLGSAVFTTVSISATTIDKKQVVISLKCTEPGHLPNVNYGDTAGNTAGSNFDFYTKALARIATVHYETVSKCHIVDFALKATVFMRISGRQLTYGTDNVRPGYSVSDNGIKSRSMFFKISFREAGTTEWQIIPWIFAISRAADNDNFVYIRFGINEAINESSSSSLLAQLAFNWEFKMDPIVAPAVESAVNTNFFYLENSGGADGVNLEPYRLKNGVSITPFFESTGIAYTGINQGVTRAPQNNSPVYLNEWNLFSNDETDIQFSFDSGPEVTVTAVTEQLIQPFSDYDQKNEKGKVIRRLYHGLSLFGFNAYSGKTIQDLRSLTVFATQGRAVRRLRTSGNDPSGKPWGTAGYQYYPSSPDGPSSLAPDIFLDTVLDKEDGIGNYAVPDGLDLRQLALTKRFCIRNKLFMDCVIADPRSWREFWSEVAPYSLLEFARIGGRETLVPAVPYNSNTGAISRDVKVSALFNAGNILEDSYKEEYLDYGSNVQDIIASIVYTDTSDSDDEIFAKKRSVDVQLADSNDADSIRQSFDVSAYVSSREQAILFGKLLCNTRRYVRQAIEFKTYPTSDPVSPGAFIYVDIGQNNWDQIRTGMVGEDGRLNTPLNNTPVNGAYKFMLYRSERGMVTLDNVVVSNGASPSLTAYENFLFVLGTEVTKRRVFRISEVSMDEEGETTIRATIYPCTPDGQSLIADFRDELFTIRS